MTDAVFTYVALVTGMIVEANPLLVSTLFRVGPGAAMAIRGGVGLALLFVLWRLAGSSTFARAAMTGVALVLGFLSAYHLLGYGGIVR